MLYFLTAICFLKSIPIASNRPLLLYLLLGLNMKGIDTHRIIITFASDDGVGHTPHLYLHSSDSKGICLF